MTPLLSARAASFALRGRALVDGVSLDLEPGRFVVIAGPNGAGKTTLFRLLSGELRPTAGEILCAGEPMTDVPPWRLACRRAVMTQTARLAFAFTVAEVVRLGVDGIGRLSAAERGRIVERALADADLLPLASRRYDALSGGEQRRTQFARALAQLAAGATLADSQALLLDEPVANLDLSHQFALLDAAREAARRGTAVLAILHDLNLAVRYADRILLLRDGRAVASGPPGEALDSRIASETFGLDLALTQGQAGPLIVPGRWLAGGARAARTPDL